MAGCGQQLPTLLGLDEQLGRPAVRLWPQMFLPGRER
jgi:hypothetical protein